MPAPDRVLELAELFARNREAYRSGRYNETQVRREFIDPLFEALGWDVQNTRGYAAAYKVVVHEDAIRIGGATTAPECFRIGGTRKFFLEAKKPSVDIRGDIHPAYQLRRCVWSARSRRGMGRWPAWRRRSKSERAWEWGSGRRGSLISDCRLEDG